jgi:hypothetical protein
VYLNTPNYIKILIYSSSIKGDAHSAKGLYTTFDISGYISDDTMKKDEPLVCCVCGFTILRLMPYVKNDKTGEVMCLDCHKEVFDGKE